jgi:hypothetical protein
MNWQTDTLWFEVAVVSMMIASGHIFWGHFEERTPALRKFFKYLLTLIVVVGLSHFFGRLTAFSVLAAAFIPVLYIHFIMLPKKGINGWTGEPKEKYYELRKWDKNIFGK